MNTALGFDLLEDLDEDTALSTPQAVTYVVCYVLCDICSIIRVLDVPVSALQLGFPRGKCLL